MVRKLNRDDLHVGSRVAVICEDDSVIGGRLLDIRDADAEDAQSVRAAARYNYEVVVPQPRLTQKLYIVEFEAGVLDFEASVIEIFTSREIYPKPSKANYWLRCQAKEKLATAKAA